MAGQRSSVWGIDIGQCALKAVRLTFDAKADRAVAQAFDYIEHSKILSQPDADPDELIKAALDKFVERNDLSGSEIYISVPGQAGLARFVKLPPVEPKKVPDIVNFEARQQIPFSLDDVVWDYQKIGSGGEDESEGPVELEVGIFAIKKENVRKQLAPFQSHGMDVHVVQLAPVALYNFTAFDIIYHQLSGAAKPAEGAEATAPAEDEEEGDTIVILDIGADKTDVVITDGDSIWLRNLPIGGNHFTRSLTKDLKLSFAKAEHLKRNATKAPDPKKLYQAMRPVFQDFVGELQRSIGFFASSHRGSVIRKVVGMGNGFKLPGLQKFLQQNLQYRIDKVSNFAGLVGEEIVTQPAFTENIMSFCVAYGLALQGLHQTPIQTNLLPNEIRTARLIRDKKPWSLAAAAALLLGCAGTYVGNYLLYKTVNAPDFKTQTTASNQAASQFNKFKTDFQASTDQYNGALANAKRLIGSERVVDRDLWLKAMKIVNSALPPRQKEDVRDVANLNEVNLDMVKATYLPGAGEWWEKSVRTTMVAEDAQAPPASPGWLIQIKGYTYNKDEKLYVTRSILTNLQSPAMRQQGITHAVLAQAEWKPDWTPSSGPIIQDTPAVGKGHKDVTVTSTSTANRPVARSAFGPTAKNQEKDKYQELPTDMKDYMKESEDRNKAARGSSKLKRTDFVIQFFWNPKYQPPPPAAPGTASPDGGVPPAPGGPGVLGSPTPPVGPAS